MKNCKKRLSKLCNEEVEVTGKNVTLHMIWTLVKIISCKNRTQNVQKFGEEIRKI